MLYHGIVCCLLFMSRMSSVIHSFCPSLFFFGIGSFYLLLMLSAYFSFKLGPFKNLSYFRSFTGMWSLPQLALYGVKYIHESLMDCYIVNLALRFSSWASLCPYTSRVFLKLGVAFYLIICRSPLDLVFSSFILSS